MIITRADKNFRFDEATHKYYYNDIEVAGVSSVLKAANLSNIGFIPRNILERSSRFGNAVHLATELYDKGELDEDTLDPALASYVTAWAKFLSDSGYKVEHIEAKVYSKKYNYMGTLDRVLVNGAKRAICDLKSGLIYPYMAIQTSSYQEAFNEGLKAKDHAGERLVVQLKDDGTYSLPKKEFYSKNDFAVFKACLTIRNWRKNNGHTNGN